MKTKKYLCACCGQYTLLEENFSDVCPVCNWQDEPYQNENPDLAGGANDMSLNQAKEAFKKGLPID